MRRKTCENCGEEFSKSTYYRHIKKCGVENETRVETHSENTVETHSENTGENTVENTGETEEGPPPSQWESFTITEEVTERIPQPVKMLKTVPKTKKKKRMTNAEKKNLKDTEIAVLKLGLSGVDKLITLYGRGVWEEEYECIHSDNEKELVAGAQHEWLSEKGITVSDKIGTGTVALALTAGYVAPPIMKINKGAKISFTQNLRRRVVKKGLLGRALSRLTFWRKKDLVIQLSEDDIYDE